MYCALCGYPLEWDTERSNYASEVRNVHPCRNCSPCEEAKLDGGKISQAKLDEVVQAYGKYMHDGTCSAPFARQEYGDDVRFLVAALGIKVVDQS